MRLTLNPRKLSLQWRILLATTLSVALVSLFGLLLVLHERIEGAERQFNRSALVLAQALMPTLESAVAEGDMRTMQQALDTVVAQGAVDRIWVTNPQQEYPVVRAEAPVDPKAARAPEWFERYVGAGDGVFWRPVLVREELYGFVRLELSARELNLELWESTQRFVSVGTVCLLAIALLLRLVVRAGLQPLNDLARAARGIAEGDWQARVPDTRVAELVPVAAAFNQMGQRVHEREVALRDASDSAEAGARAKAAFLATMSHEIRTPMNAIIGMTDLALDAPLPPEQREQLRTVRSSAEALLVLINDILDFSKIEAGKFDIEQRATDLHAVVQGVLHTVEAARAAAPVELRVRIDPDVPPWVLTDAGRLRQVLLNLMSNAVKFTPRGHVTLAVARGPDGADLLLFSVADTGIGVAPERQARIFDPFTQEDGSISRRYGGTGLGLTICARLVTLMGGRIWLSSTPGSGSTFSFTAQMPACAPVAVPDTEVPEISASAADAALYTAGVAESAVPMSSDPAAPPSPTAPTPSTGAAVRPCTVLLVEDHPVNQTLATAVLRRQGHTVEVAENGAVALQRLAEKRYDLIFMDMQMPVMDGLEATRRFRASETGPRTPIIAMTANAMQGDRETCLAAGMDDYVSKPFRKEDLAAAIARHIAG